MDLREELNIAKAIESKLKADLKFQRDLVASLEEENLSLLRRIESLQTCENNVNQPINTSHSLDFSINLDEKGSTNENEELIIKLKELEKKNEDLLDLVKYYENAKLEASQLTEIPSEMVLKLNEELAAKNALLEIEKGNIQQLIESFAKEREEAQCILEDMRRTVSELKDQLQQKEEELFEEKQKVLVTDHQVCEKIGEMRGNSVFSELDDRRTKAEQLVNELREENKSLRYTSEDVYTKIDNLEFVLHNLATERNAEAEVHKKRALQAWLDLRTARVEIENMAKEINKLALTKQVIDLKHFKVNEFHLTHMQAFREKQMKDTEEAHNKLQFEAKRANELSLKVACLNLELVRLKASKNKDDKENKMPEKNPRMQEFFKPSEPPVKESILNRKFKSKMEPDELDAQISKALSNMLKK
ncbi:component of the polarisome [Cichlidogyrus casuarinus]|uniref:Component of the polarisome n=1 Tax=Cichlidogyrus casuarinus TaxID=1844966 RepID=A0ABD2QHP7_9PLAT